MRVPLSSSGRALSLSAADVLSMPVLSAGPTTSVPHEAIIAMDMARRSTTATVVDLLMTLSFGQKRALQRGDPAVAGTVVGLVRCWSI